jgi:hypothetical protein
MGGTVLGSVLFLFTVGGAAGEARAQDEAFVPSSPEVRAAASGSGYGVLIANLLSYHARWSGRGDGAQPLRNGSSSISGNMNTDYLPEPWKSLPETRNVVAYRSLIAVDGAEATVTLVFENLSRDDLAQAGKRPLRRVPPPVAIRLAMGSPTVEVTELGPAETEEALAAMTRAIEKEAGIARVDE